MTQNEHICAICCRTEVDGDVISGENVKTVEGYTVLNFEVASISSFRDIKKIISWRRWTSTIALSENAFAFRLKTVLIGALYATVLFQFQVMTLQLARLGWTWGIENAANQNLVPTFLFDVFT